MKILFLTYYFEPDLCAGSFRNTSLFKSLAQRVKNIDSIDVITTYPNRYDSYKVSADKIEKRGDNITINRIRIPDHKSGLFGQIKSFRIFYYEAKRIAKDKNYDLVYASSSRLFTAFLGAKLARKNKGKLYLDIRDIFRESIVEIFKNPIIKIGLDFFLRPIENYTFKNANHINLVSKGFESYFVKYKQCSYSFYTNGIDIVFLNKNIEVPNEDKKLKTIVYAGNIGEGQGLHIILPKVAKAFQNKYKFIIYGDGGAKQKLISAIKEEGVENIEIKKPIDRKLLIKEYQKADFLFLHLNKYKAFERVLPSKLFEYGAFDKPIIAGVGGYASEFLKENLSNVILFEPGNVKEFIDSLKKYKYIKVRRNTFVDNFSREKINILMSQSILKTHENTNYRK
ncbi:glycosyltransferase family 4 protein [Polaribacter aestuariivivens]|uniref:Glycosyltransferase family 4 protein n=1 Tax=Polaribacter aestuariivivens TaxID=2304626 RepID=A0A5S3N3U1_9FLAO|nr:glycosyltransferase family 4 protein [Polaribacter aestuariivivens]TMM29144.1 glycosyltransferase family 4 protein [Polaribacter aestuariivivens]